MTASILKHDYNGKAIRQRETDGYVCLTDLAKSEGKLVADYLRLESTKAYVKALSESMVIPIESLILSKGGRNGSTYAHPEIGMDCAQWVSIPCRIWANRTLVKIVAQASETPQEHFIAPPSLAELSDLKRSIEYFENRGMREEADKIKLHLADQVNNRVARQTFSVAQCESAVEVAVRLGYEVSPWRAGVLGTYVKRYCGILIEGKSQRQSLSGLSTPTWVNVYPAHHPQVEKTVHSFFRQAVRNF